jgi:hypothetical protein
MLKLLSSYLSIDDLANKQETLWAEWVERVINGNIISNQSTGGFQGHSSRSIRPYTTGSVRPGAVIR